jgi:hypothetical protein
MKSIRFLSPNDQTLLDTFINTDSQINSSILLQKHWEYYRRELLQDDPELRIAAIISNGLIEAVIVGYTINYRWRRKNVMPYWAGSKLHSYNNQKILPKEKDALISLLVEHFEKIGYTACFVVVTIKNKSINTDALANKYTRRAFINLRYQFFIEKIINDRNDFDRLCNLYRLLCSSEYQEETILILKGYKVKNS